MTPGDRPARQGDPSARPQGRPARAHRFALMDSVRALAALSVLFFHAVGIYGGALSQHGLRALVARMEVGVVIFLVVSGFLLYRPFVMSQLSADAAPSVRAYLWRRVLRIVPAYWVALALAAILVPYHGVFTAGGVPTYFGFAQIYRGSTIAGGDPPAWTLGLEASFYLFLPLWAMALRAVSSRTARDLRARLRIQVAGVGGLWLFSMAYKAVLMKTGAVPVIPGSPLPALVTLPGYIDEFALGMGLAVASAWLELGGGREPAVVRVIGRRPGVAWAFALAAFLLVSLGIGLTGDPAQDYTPAQYLARNVLYGAVAVGVIAPAVFGEDRGGLVRRVLAWRPLLWIGLISYGIYVWHSPLLTRLLAWHYGQGGSHLWRYLEWGVVPLLGSIALGAASYYLVERPCLSLKRLVPDRRRQTVSEAGAEPAPLAPPGGHAPPRS
jgi:peptidoglycan/LPS O-acetylase OafA/YrhL